MNVEGWPLTYTTSTANAGFLYSPSGDYYWNDNKIPINGVVSQTDGAGVKLTPDEWRRLLDHPFMDMRSGAYCLLCYALNVFRTVRDHGIVIREE